MEGKKTYRNVEIQPVLNGFIVQVGCSRVVFTEEDQIIEAFSKWIKDPQGTEKNYQANAINGGGLVEAAAPPPANTQCAGEGRSLNRLAEEQPDACAIGRG